MLRMAGLSSRARTGIKKLLRMMSESDLQSLLDTVTNSKKLFVGSVEEIIEAIILNSNDAAEFLKRRKVQRGFILLYLAKEKIVVPPNSEKPLLVERTLKFWSDGKQLHGQRSELPQAATKADAGQSHTLKRPKMDQPQFHGQPSELPQAATKADAGQSHTLKRPKMDQPQFHGQRSELPQAATKADAGQSHALKRPKMDQPELSPQGPKLKRKIQSTKIPASLDQSGEQFCRWFFQLLNSQNPSLDQKPPPGAWGPQLFCPDAKLDITSSMIVRHVGLYQGADQVNSCLLSLVREEGLFFSPSLEHHRYRVVNPLHRLALVAVDGTIRRPPSNDILGNFEQVFGVICLEKKAKKQTNWKIKFTDLLIRNVRWDFDELKRRFT